MRKLRAPHVLLALILVLLGAQGCGKQVAQPNRASCDVQDGKWTGTVGFTVSNCVISDAVLTLATNKDGLVTAYYVYVTGGHPYHE